MKRIFASQDRAAISIVQGLLADEGIDATIQNENMSAISGEVPFTLAMPEICVLRDEDEARGAGGRGTIRLGRRAKPGPYQAVEMSKLRQDDRRAVHSVLEMRHAEGAGLSRFGAGRSCFVAKATSQSRTSYRAP